MISHAPENVNDMAAPLESIRAAAADLRQILLANLVMIGEIPAPTFSEGPRIHFICDRFAECGLHNISQDEVGNAAGVLPGAHGERDVLLVAHADTIFESRTDHTITVQGDCVTGPAVADNSLGLAALVTLPTLLERLDLKLRSNLILLASSRSLGRGDLQGLRFFLDNARVPIHAGLCVEGAQLGRLSYASLGMLRGEIRVTVPEAYDWTRFGASGAIRVLNDVMNRVLEIPLPRRPRTNIIFGTIQGGSSFSTVATHAVLQLEIRSESAETVHWISRRMEDIVAETAAESGAVVDLDIFARRDPGGVRFDHPLVARTRAIMTTLKLEPRIAPSMSELAVFIRHGVPAVTLGLSTAEHVHSVRECVQIEPMITGMTQLLAVLLAIDAGCCDED